MKHVVNIMWKGVLYGRSGAIRKFGIDGLLVFRFADITEAKHVLQHQFGPVFGIFFAVKRIVIAG